jgi:hypothetical protein
MGEPSPAEAGSPDLPDPFDGPEWQAGQPRPEQPPGTVRVRRRRKSRRRRRRRIVLGGVAALGLVLIAAGLWLAYSASQARSELTAVRNGVHELRVQLSAGNVDAARHTARKIRDEAHAAHDHTSGPVWALAAHLPGLGDAFQSARSLTSGASVLADGVVTPLLDASTSLEPDRLRSADGSVNVGVLQRLAPALRGAGTALDEAATVVARSPAHTWMGSLDAARSHLLAQLPPLRRSIAGLGKAVAVVPTALGADGPRTYLISFQNDAEIRATGGIPGAFVLLRADHGKLTLENFAPDTYLNDVTASGLNLGPDFDELYQAARQDYADSTYSPHFPDAAQIWATMWQHKTGQHIDGALAIDPTGLSYLLARTGPVTLPDGSSVTAANVVELTQKELYDRYPGTAESTARKQYLIDIAKAVSTRLLAADVDVPNLMRAAGQAAREHRLLMWSRDANVAAEIRPFPLSGLLPATGGPFVGLGLNNDSQSKLDYYLHATMDWQRSGCGPERDVTASVTLTNSAPAGLPPYVLGQSDPPGTETLDVALYGSIGGRFTKVTVDGHAPFYVAGKDQGHPTYVASVPVAPGRTVTVVFHLREPAGKGPVEVREQPMINPMTVTTHDDAHC